MEIFLGVVWFLVIFFIVTFIIYFYNLDIKLLHKLYDLMAKRFDNMERDRKL